MPAIDPKALADKIAALPVDRIAEVEDFVDFLHSRDRDRALLRAAGAASEPAFAAVWDKIPKTTSTMPFEFADIVLVPFPFTSQTASKQRPAVVVSSRAYGVERPDLVLMAITSQIRPTPRSRRGLAAPLAGRRTAQALRRQAGHRHPRTGPRHPLARRLGAEDRDALRCAIAQILG